jgi:outer membrane protein TolC
MFAPGRQARGWEMRTMSHVPSSWTRARGLSAAIVASLVIAAAPVAGQQVTTPQAPQAAGPTLALSMEQAVAMALETSLGLKAERLNLDIAAEGIASARAAFLPILSGGFSRQTRVSVPTNFTEGSNDISSRSFGGQSTISQTLPWYGGRYSADWSNSRLSQVGGFPSFSPQLGSTLTLNFTQPLWRNFKIDSARAGLQTSERRREIADIQLEQRVVGTQAAVRNAYLGLIAAIEGHKVAQQNMDLAIVAQRNARSRVAVGVSPSIETIQFDAQVASNEEQLIVATAQISTAEDALRSLILETTRPDYWQVRIQPTDTIEVEQTTVDVDAAIKNALANRLDLIVLRRTMDITDLNIRLSHNLTNPSVDFNVNYAASGTGGTQFAYGEGAPPPLLGQTQKSFGSVLSDAFGGAYPTWRMSVSVGYPLGRSSARAALAQQELQKQQDLITLRDAEVQVVRDVRDAARQVQTSYQRVQATRTAREASEKQLEAEDRRLAVGLGSTFEQQQRQTQLAQARVNELRAKILYQQALINLETVQKIR